jgi:hypothetical protein
MWFCILVAGLDITTQAPVIASHRIRLSFARRTRRRPITPCLSTSFVGSAGRKSFRRTLLGTNTYRGVGKRVVQQLTLRTDVAPLTFELCSGAGHSLGSRIVVVVLPLGNWLKNRTRHHEKS